MQIQFDKIKRKTRLLSVANLPHVVRKAMPAAPPVMPKVVADKAIDPEIKPE